jgi:hypothetical protein
MFSKNMVFCPAGLRFQDKIRRLRWEKREKRRKDYAGRRPTGTVRPAMIFAKGAGNRVLPKSAGREKLMMLGPDGST